MNELVRRRTQPQRFDIRAGRYQRRAHCAEGAEAAASSSAMLPDQVPKRAGAEFAPFFGQPALTMTLTSNLLQKTGARP